MASIAGCLCVAAGVAHLALELYLAAMIQWEAMHQQLSWRPRLCRMAVLALQTEEPGVDFRLGMALHTVGRCARELLLLVAVTACNIGVQTLEREEAGMVEIAHAIGAIVAVQALVAELIAVRLHENRLLLAAGMAVNARLQVNLLQADFVAAQTGHRLVVVILRVSSQTEAEKFFVVEGYALQRCRRPTGGCVALVAGSGENSAMHFWLLVALCALCGCVFKRIADRQASICGE